MSQCIPTIPASQSRADGPDCATPLDLDRRIADLDRMLARWHAGRGAEERDAIEDVRAIAAAYRGA